jgi:threonine synthase
VTVGALQRAIEEGTVRREEEVVLVITGNGLKTLDVLTTDAASLPEAIPPSFSAFEDWWARSGQPDLAA